MNYELLKRLFTSCSDEEGGHYADGLNLPELYEQMEEVSTATQHWEETLDKAAFESPVEDDMQSAAYELARAYELQGFINGFRLCAQMRRELGELEVSA